MAEKHQVWVDVGGTFTDCFVLTPDGQRFRGKVLSSGLSKGTVDVVTDRSEFRALPTTDQSRLLPDHFWEGASISLLGLGDRGAARVTRYRSHDRSFEISSPPDQALLQGQMFELDAGLEAPVLAVRQLLGIGLSKPLPPLDVRLGTTRGTNALLTRTGAPLALITTRGFGDVLRIGSQERPELFRLDIRKPPALTEDVIEIDERLASDGSVLIPLSKSQVENSLSKLYERGIRSLAICLLHSYLNDVHEQVVEEIAKDIGFTNISVSSRISRLIKFVPRSETSALDAYLSPILHAYIDRVWQQFGGSQNTRLRLMTSAGQLVSGEAFRGCDSVLSGPAGGVVALAAAGDAVFKIDGKLDGVIGFDMGGTSTDVSRYQGRLVKQLESRKAGVRVMTPMLAIHTVAAGGGSICHVENGRLMVGPESAGSFPGPACYGNDGPLTVTDLNLILGRVVPEHFPFNLNKLAANERLESLRDQLRAAGVNFDSVDILAEGFLRIANNHMSEAVRTVTTSEGSDPRMLGLVCYGGAAGQHACAVADSLGMTTIIDHPDASMFSALGMGLAAVGRSATFGIYRDCNSITASEVTDIVQQLAQQAQAELHAEVNTQTKIRLRSVVEMRYVGTESPLSIDILDFRLSSNCDSIDDEDREGQGLMLELRRKFEDLHQKNFGYQRPNRGIELVTITVDAEAISDRNLSLSLPDTVTSISSPNVQQVFFEHALRDVPLYERTQLCSGQAVQGPALIAGPHNTLFLLNGWDGVVCDDGTLYLRRRLEETFNDAELSQSLQQMPSESTQQEPIELEVTARRLEGIAEQMGEILRRSSVSVNVKERLDYSCAVFDNEGYLIAGAMHVPVHLGAMGYTVRNLMKRFPRMSDGDCFVSNNPYAGGSHLPDVTVVSPVFVAPSSPQPEFYVASRAHHAEIGGITPGSMPPNATRLEQEGVVIDAFPLVRNGVSHEDELKLLLTGASFPSRNPIENLADISAQVAAGRRGAEDLRALALQQGPDVLQQRMKRLLSLSADALADVIDSMDDNPHTFEDQLIVGYPIQVTLQRKNGRLQVDFSGTSAQHEGGWNATPAIVSAALLYVLRCMTNRPLPLCEGVLSKVDLYIPEGLLNPCPLDPIGLSPAVVAGNVETSQRVVDCLLGALGAAAASQGTMNNLLVGDDSFGYYETICGGAGATSKSSGADAVQTHMTNTRITDPEILETRYPMRLWRYQIRSESGGHGIHRGGNGVIRELEFLRPLTVSMLSSRRAESRPYGLQGGEPGLSGRNTLIHDGVEEELDGSFSIQVEAGQRLRIETPGGGGFGTA